MADKPILERTFNEEMDVEKKVEEGCIYSRLYIEVQGNDKDKCEQALRRVIFDSLGHEPNVHLLTVKFFELQKDEEKNFYSGVVEVESLFRDFRWFINIVMRYGPSAIEIIEPQKGVSLSLEEMQAVIADISEQSQILSTRLLNLLKDDERKKVFERMLKEDK
jgi:hypothetical protein